MKKASMLKLLVKIWGLIEFARRRFRSGLRENLEGIARLQLPDVLASQRREGC